MIPNERTQPANPTRSATPILSSGNTPAKPGKLLRLPRVMDLTALGKSSIYSKTKDGTFPAPVRLSARAVGWREADIFQWIESRTTRAGV